MNSKWLKHLNIRHDTIKLLEDITGKTFPDINHTIVFLGQPPKAIERKIKRNKWVLIKLISFYTAKETTNKTKRQHTEWKKIFAHDANDKGLISKIYKQLIQFNNKKQTTQQKMGRSSCHGAVGWVASLENQDIVSIPCQHSGLRIQCSRSCGLDPSCSWDLIPGLGTPYATGYHKIYDLL